MNKIARTTISLMVITLLSKFLGFLREIILMNSYGLSSYSDVYITTMNIPIVVFAGVGTALATTFIPVYYEVCNEEGEYSALKFVNNIFNIIFFITIILSITGFLFAKPIIKLFAIGFEGETLELAISFIRIMIWGIIFIGAKSIFTAYLQIKDDFTIPGLIGIPYNIIIIISIIFSMLYSNISLLAIGTLLAMISQFIFQVPYAVKKGYRYKFFMDFKDKYVQKMMYLVLPVFIGVGVTQINIMVDRTLASTLQEGSIAALNSANKLNEFVMGIFIATIASVIYPRLAKISNEKNDVEFKKNIIESINSVILIVVPISIGAIALSSPIVRLLFERGAFDSKSTEMTSTALMFYSIGMVAFGLREILNKIFYAIKDTRTPMINAAICVAINIILNIILSKVMGHAGLAFATSISAVVCIVLLFNSLKSKIGDFGQVKIIKVYTKALISSILMGLTVYFLHKFIILSIGRSLVDQIIALSISISVGAALYIYLILKLKVEEANLTAEYIKNKMKIFINKKQLF